MSSFSAETGETIVGHEERDGAVAAHVTEISPRDETVSTTVSRSALVEAIKTDLGDSYPSAYVWSDEETLAVTDHQTATLTPDAGRLEDFGSVDIVRVNAVETSDDANSVLVYREATADALDELAVGSVTVHVEPNAPLVIEEESNAGVAIAPRVKPSNLTEAADD